MKRGEINIGKNKIEYIHGGKGTEILFLHGGSVSYRTYIPFLKMLSGYFHIWAPSMPGAGKSSVLPKHWRIEDYSDFVCAFTKQMRITPILMGHSLGGAVAVKSISEQLGLFRGLVLMAPAGMKYETPRNAIMNVVKDKFKIILSQDEGAGNERRDLLVNLLCHPFDQSKIADIFAKLSLGKDIEKIKCNTLLLWGRKDKIFNEEYRTSFEKRIKKKNSYIFNAPHGFVNKARREITKILRDEYI